MAVIAKEQIEQDKKDTSKLLKYPINTLLEVFPVTNELFSRPINWYVLSETEKTIKFLNWMKYEINSGFDITFSKYDSFEDTLKQVAIRGMSHINES